MGHRSTPKLLPSDDWSKIKNPAERRKVQNRIAQRNYRKKLKQRLNDLEHRFALDSASSEGSPSPQHELPSLVAEQQESKAQEWQSSEASSSSPSAVDENGTYVYTPGLTRNSSPVASVSSTDAYVHGQLGVEGPGSFYDMSPFRQGYDAMAGVGDSIFGYYFRYFTPSEPSSVGLTPGQSSGSEMVVSTHR